MTQAFISHSSTDADFAQRIADGLRNAGVAVWISPDSILPGERFVEAIQRGLSESTHFVLIMSPDALESEWVQEEIDYAIRQKVAKKMTLYPIMYRPCDPPPFVGGRQYLKYEDNDADILRQLIAQMGVADERAWARPAPVGDEQIAAAQTELDTIASEVLACTRCPLAEERAVPVPGSGPPNAQLFFIGEAPGPEDDQSGVPFISAAGEFLGELLEMIHISRADVYLTNIVKCRPAANRDPQKGEVHACAGYLDRQIKAINPRVIVTLGRHSLNCFISGATISGIHGQPQPFDGRFIIPMYHPAAALYRNRYRSILIKDFLDMEQFLSARR